MSTEMFSALSGADLELLAILNEECAEVQQAISKILRHGFDSVNPVMESSPDNRTALAEEIGHLLYAITLVQDTNLVDRNKVQNRRRRKKKSIQQWLHYQHESR